MTRVFEEMRRSTRRDTEQFFWFLHNHGPDDAGSCWIAPMGRRDRRGYCRIRVGRRSALAHRLALAWHMGLDSDLDLPGQFTVDHVWEWGCTSTSCVNPRHLQLVTPIENSRRVAKTREVKPPRWVIDSCSPRTRRPQAPRVPPPALSRHQPADPDDADDGCHEEPMDILARVVEAFPDRRRTNSGKVALADVARHVGMTCNDVRSELRKDGIEVSRTSVRPLAGGGMPTTVLTVGWPALSDAVCARARANP